MSVRPVGWSTPTVRGVEPPFDHPDCVGTRLRAPNERLVVITPTVTELTGPAFGESALASRLATITAKLARRCVQAGRSSAAPRKAARHAPVTERIEMKAFVLESFETEPRYRETPDPQPAEGEVRIRVAASSVNGFDVAVAGGFMRHVFEYRFPAILGSDYAGVVDAVGADVADFARGEEVFGCVRRESLRDGAWAEYVVVPERSGIATKPSTVDMMQAGSLALAGVLRCAPLMRSSSRRATRCW